MDGLNLNWSKLTHIIFVVKVSFESGFEFSNVIESMNAELSFKSTNKIGLGSLNVYFLNIPIFILYVCSSQNLHNAVIFSKIPLDSIFFGEIEQDLSSFVLY